MVTEQEAIASFLADFGSFLNENNFSVSPSALERATRIVSDFAEDETSLARILKPILCQNRAQYISFGDLFYEFFRRYDRIAKQAKKKDDLKGEHAQKMQEAQSFLAKQDTLFEEERRAVEKQIDGVPISVSGACQKDLQKRRKELQSVLGEELASMLAEGRFAGISAKSIGQAQKALLEKATAALTKKGDVDAFQKWSKLFDRLTAVSKAKEKSDKTTDDIRQEFEKKRQNAQKAYEKAQREAEEIQRQIDAMLSENAPMKLVQKNAARSHRPIFVGKNAVQVSEEAPACIDTSFNRLSEQEKAQIEAYLKQNLVHFKTKLTRHIHIMNKAQIDMYQTIQDACKTGGIPMKISYKKPKAGKVNLLLVLDVSGSCKEASAMMLAFIYLLSSVFPRGCHAYAFVNKLYDISETLHSEDIDTATKKVLSLIPTRSVYSNYSIPMEQLWNDHRKELTSDTIVIFMGDARNNKNDPMYDTVKNICHKVKRAFWLNTETVDEWDTADSLASGYGRYAKMFEVANMRELIGFIQEGIR